MASTLPAKEFLEYTYTFNGLVYVVYDDKGFYIGYSHTEIGAWAMIRSKIRSRQR